jgi:hypothetical protein
MKKKIKTVTVAIVVTLSLPACGSTTLYSLATKPYTLDTNPPEGPPTYQAGWLDGCKSGMSANNTNLHMTLGSQKFVINNRLRDDQLYNIAWQYAYNHCGYSMKALAQYSL